MSSVNAKNSQRLDRIVMCTTWQLFLWRNWRNPWKWRKGAPKMDMIYCMFFFNTIKVDIPESEYLHNLGSQTIFQSVWMANRSFVDCDESPKTTSGRIWTSPLQSKRTAEGILVVSITFCFYFCAYAFREIIQFDYNILSKRLKPPTSWDVELSDCSGNSC